MAASRNSRLLCVLLTALLTNTQAASAESGKAGFWNDAMKVTVTQGCRQTMLHTALEAYRGKHGLRRTQLPKDLKQRLEDQLADQLAVCDCVTDKASERWDFAYFMREQANLADDIREYVSSGNCLPAAGDPLQ